MIHTIALSFVLSLFAAACGGAPQNGTSAGLLAAGQPAPALTSVDHNGTSVSTTEGGPVIVYFYPRDATPGCTKEACAFRDAWMQYQAAGVRIIGVSADSLESHRSFAQEHELPFSLVSDEKHLWAKAFGVGSYLGMTKRVSFLIDGRGVIRKVYPDVDPGVHATEVLAAARALGVVKE